VLITVFFKLFESNDNIHQEDLGMIQLDIPTDHSSIFTQAPCSISQGNQNKLGQQKPIESRIYLNDSL